MKVSRRFRWAILLFMLFAGVLVSPALLLRRPRHLTPDDMLRLRRAQLVWQDTEQEMSRQDVEALLGPPTVYDPRWNRSTWQGWSYSLQGRYEISFSLRCDNEGRTIVYGFSETERPLWEPLKDWLAEVRK